MSSYFSTELRERNNDPAGRRWVYVPYDQVSDQVGPLSRHAPDEMGIVLVESPWKPARRPYHKQKLAVILANMRHFALEQAERGVAVRHVVVNGPYRQGLEQVLPEIGGQISMMQAAERELRVDLKPLVADGRLAILPHEGWVTTAADFIESVHDSPPWRMDVFYRKVRQKFGILMVDGKPVGGKYSFDTENRQRWNGQPLAPEMPSFPVDKIKLEVGDLIEKHFQRHPGALNLERLAATADDAALFWDWAKTNSLPLFGPFEDAMSVQSTNLFHTHVSTLLNICRLLPIQLVNDVLAMEDVPLASKEGFIRQIIGWREYMRHIHESTDGFRRISGNKTETSTVPGDGGYELWAGTPWISESLPADAKSKLQQPQQEMKQSEEKLHQRKQKLQPDAQIVSEIEPNQQDPDGGACPSHLNTHNPLPPAFWGKQSGLHCLDHVVQSVWNEGYSHHITRLMVLSNIASLLDIEPRQLTDWFWVAYTDAYDWVVEPNVLVMGTYSVGEIATTKPYISGAAYINKMSDYCRDCQFDPSKNCPITPMYWAYLKRHEDKLSKNFRLQMPYRSLEKRSPQKRDDDRRIYEAVLAELVAGRSITPDVI